MKKSSGLKPQGPEPYLCQVCSNNALGVKNGPARGSHIYIALYRENKKKSSCLKPEGLDHYLSLNKTGAHSTGERFRANMALLFILLLDATSYDKNSEAIQVLLFGDQYNINIL